MSEINEFVTVNDLNGFAKKSDLTVSQDMSAYAKKSDLNIYAKKTDITSIPDLNAYVKKSDISSVLDLSDYAKKSDIPNSQDMNSFAKKTDIPVIPDLSVYAKKSDINNNNGVAQSISKAVTIPSSIGSGTLNFVRNGNLVNILGNFKTSLQQYGLSGIVPTGFRAPANDHVASIMIIATSGNSYVPIYAYTSKYGAIALLNMSNVILPNVNYSISGTFQTFDPI